MQRDILKQTGFTILDGGLGTMLQQAGMLPGQLPEAFMLEKPEALTAIHAAYVDAGADILFANTFGSNAKKLDGTGISVEQAVETAVRCAKAAAGGKALVALDIGPLGEMLEPNGTLAFEDAYTLFAQVAKAGQVAGADLVMVETMTDLYETKAAVLAVLEQTGLPVMASMTFEEDGRTFAGVPVEAFAATIGGLGPVALGINCSLGPAQIMPLLQRLCDATPLPVFAMPNAGMPDPLTGKHQLSPEDFCREMEPCAAMGVSLVGGCCGTTPDTIRLLADRFKGATPVTRVHQPALRVCGATAVTTVDGPMAIGERINPTGKKRLREALQAGDLGYVQTLAVEQEQAGAAILDVNVGAPGVDEVALLPAAVKAVQAVSGLPLQLDSANADALAAALRVCCGKPLVNSTSGEAEKMDAILPLCQKYGAAVVGLTLDEDGIPDTAEKRVAIAQRILDGAMGLGMPRQDVCIDCLTLSVGAEPGAGGRTLQAVRLVKERLGLATVLGVSNVSFGLPGRPLINRTFLSMALQAGLDLPILNPMDDGMMGALAAYRLLCGQDEGAVDYVARFGQPEAEAPKTGADLALDEAIIRGLKEEATKAAKRLLDAGESDKLAIVNQYLIPALDKVGQGFEQKRIFLPQLLSSAAAAQAAFEVIRAAMGTSAGASGPPVVVATVQGDVHDIGKNIAKVLLENYDFTVIDLGRDVPPGAVVEAVKKSGARLVGLSALMTTTLPAMEATIAALHAQCPGCKVMVGGAVLTGEYAKKIGADCHAVDAKRSADYAREVYGVS